MNKQPNSVMS